MLKMKSETGPTLVAGAFDMVFGEFEKVEEAIAFTDLPAAGNNSFQAKTAISGNTVTVTIYKVDLNQATDADRDYAAAVTADLAGKVVTVIAEGY